MIKSGADLNEQDTNGWTILHHSCERGLKEIVEMLIKEKKYFEYLNVNKRTNKRTNKSLHALHLAASNNYPDIIKILLEIGLTE